MSANAILTTAVERWERRRRVGVILERLPYAMLPGLAAGTVLAVYARLRPGPEDTVSLLVALGGAALGVLILLAWVWLRRTSPVESARWFDLRFGLQERVSTALELLDGRINADEGLITHQVADAERTASSVNAQLLLPLTTDWRVWTLNLALLAVLAFIMLVVPPVVAADDELARQRAAIDTAAGELSEIIQDIAADPSLTDEQRGPLLEALQAQLDTLRDPNLTLDEAIATLGEVEAGFSERASDLQTEIQQQQMAEAAANAAMEQLAPDAAASTLSQNLESVQNDLDQMSPDQLQAAAEALENAADALQSVNPDAAEAMRDAAEAMREGDLDAARQALARAAAESRRADAETAQQQGQQRAMQQAAQQASAAQQQAAEQSGSEGEGQQGEEGQGQGEGESGQGQDNSMTGQLGQEGDMSGENGTMSGPPSDSATTSDASQPSEFGAGGDGQGDGTADLSHDASSNSQQRGENRDTPNNPDGDGQREYEPVFSPRYTTEVEGDDEVRLGADPGDTPLTEGDFQDNPIGQSVVPYNQVFSSYADAASRALDSDYIPLGMRDVVREYFSSLDPQQSR